MQCLTLPLRMPARCYAPANTAFAIFLLLTCGISIGWMGRGWHETITTAHPVGNRMYAVPFVAVVDGDTIKVKWNTQVTSVRMLTINTPERGQPGYRQATDHLKAMLGNTTTVMLEFEKDGVHARDRFGRLLCYVWLEGKCLNVEQVRAGHSTYWTKYGAGKYPTEFQVAMREAQGAR